MWPWRKSHSLCSTRPRGFVKSNERSKTPYGGTKSKSEAAEVLDQLCKAGIIRRESGVPDSNLIGPACECLLMGVLKSRCVLARL